MSSSTSSNPASSSFGRRLEGKVAIVTGGATGMGEATARLFSLHGARVVIADVQDDLGRSVCASIGSDDIAVYAHCDVSDETDVKNLVDFTVSKFGRLDIMFNNAGIIERPSPRIVDSDVSAFERTMSVNCTGVFLGIKHAARAMIAAGTRGSIINNGSASTAVGGLGPHGYVASKHAVVGLTKNAAAELGRYGIRVNCVSPFLTPSTIATRLNGREGGTLEEWVSGVANLKGGAVLRTEDTAAAAVYFAGDESQYVSGVNFVIDGGFTSVNNAFGVFEQRA